MTAGYTPRHNDTVAIRDLRVIVEPDGRAWLPAFGMQVAAFEAAVAAGKVELVARAEPDWKHGEIGRDRETGALYAYANVHPVDDEPWFQLTDWQGETYRWFSREALAGKLERMRLVSQTESQPLADELWKLACSNEAHGDKAAFYARLGASVEGDVRAQVPQVGDGGTNVGADESPGLYRDAAGAPWMQRANLWVTVNDDGVYTRSEVDHYGPFEPLFTVDELIPDPDDKDAVEELVYEAQDHKPRGEYAVTVVIRAALQALRARAEAREGAA